jgi:hypothetical protein
LLRSTRFAHDETRLQPHAAVVQGHTAFLDLLQHQVEGGSGDPLEGLGDRGEGRRQHGGKVDIVEPDDGEIVRDAPTEPIRRTEGADRRHIRARRDRS